MDDYNGFRCDPGHSWAEFESVKWLYRWIGIVTLALAATGALVYVLVEKL